MGKFFKIDDRIMILAKFGFQKIENRDLDMIGSQSLGFEVNS